MDAEQYFKGGLRNDEEPSVQLADTYRNGEGFRLISYDGNTFALESLKGNKVSWHMPNKGYFPIGWTRIEEDIIVFSTNDNSGNDSNGEIGIVSVNRTTGSGSYVPLYNHQGLKFNSAHQIETIAWPETNRTKRTYWVDWYNTLRSFNYANPVYQTLFASGSLVPGTQYMVVEGNITHNAITYGPTDPNGTVFTAINAVYTINTTPVRVIAYTNISVIDVVPRNNIGQIKFKTLLDNGTVMAGQWRFAYRLLTNDGTITSWSYLSSPVNVGNSNGAFSGTRRYQEYQGQFSALSSGRGIEITISSIDTNFDKIQVAAMRAVSSTSEDPPILFFDGAITSSSMDFDYFGSENLAQLTADDLIKPTVSFKRVGTLAPVKYRLYIGRVENYTDVVWDASAGAVIDTFPYLVPADQNGRFNNSDTGFADCNQAGLYGTQYQFRGGVGLNDLLTDQWYEVQGGTVLYNAVNYVAGSHFQCVPGVHSYSVVSGSPVIYAVFKIQRYTGVFDYPRISEWADAKSPAMPFYLKSHMRKERYRLAVVLWDPFGNPFFAHWLGDKTIPGQTATVDPDTGNPLSYLPNLCEEYSGDYGTGSSGSNLVGISVKNIGLKVSNLDFQPIADYLGITLAEISTYFSGFSIVRAECDKQILAQGLLWPTVIDGSRTRPSAVPILTNDFYGNANGRRNYSYNFYSPDVLFQSVTPQDGDKLEIEDYYTDSYQAATYGTLFANNYNFYQKMCSRTSSGIFPGPGTRNNIDVRSTQMMDVGCSDNAYGLNGFMFDNRTKDKTGDIDGANDREATGASNMLVGTLTDESVTLPHGFAATNVNKPLVNYLRLKGTLYGGTSDAAKANTVYHFIGHYQSFDSAFISYISGNAGKADDIEIWGGDSYVQLFDIGRMIKDSGSGALQFSDSLVYPVESRINVLLRQNRHVGLDWVFDAANVGINLNGVTFPDKVENFDYNTAYSYEEATITFQGFPQGFIPDGLFDKRVYASEVKINGELVDNFKNFLVANFKDLKNSGGVLMNLRSRLDRLYYWQQDDVGYLPANERSVLPSTLGDPMTIGTGGILERYDETTDFYGNQHQFGLADTEDYFVWTDLRRKVLCVMSFAGDKAEISTEGGLMTYLANVTGAVLNFDNPVMNRGIASAFNDRFKEIWIVLRGFTNRYFEKADGILLRYDLLNKCFVGADRVLPGIMLRAFNNIFLSSTSFTHPTILPSHVYNYGDIISDDQVIAGGTGQNYICITAYTTPSGSPPIDAHWKAIYKMDEIYAENLGDVMKFYGYVRDSVITIVVNAEPKAHKRFLHWAMQSDQNFFDTAEYRTTVQTGIDLDITNNPEYEFRDRNWIATVANDTNEKSMVDHYLIIKFTKKNEVGNDLTTSKNEILKIVSLITSYYKAL